MGLFIYRQSDLNWVVAKTLPKRIALRGLSVGKEAKQSYKDLGYFNNLKHAVRSLLDDTIGELVPTQATGKEILEAIEIAEKRVIDYLEKEIKNPDFFKGKSYAPGSQIHNTVETSKIDTTYLEIP